MIESFKFFNIFVAYNDGMVREVNIFIMILRNLCD